MSTKAEYLVTGAAGFIGSSIARALLARGERVRGVDDFSTGHRRNLERAPGMEFLEGDLSRPEVAEAACAGARVIFHEAAIPSVPRSVADPEECHRANVTATVNVLLAAKAAGAERVVFAASSAAYGNEPTLPKREDMAPDPQSPYAAAKLASEHYLASFAASQGLATVSLRYFNVFGPHQDAASAYAAVLSKFITAMLAGSEPVIFGDGEQSRDFIYIDNVIEANLLAAAAPAAAVAGKTLNVATGRAVTLNQVVRLLRPLTGYDGEVRYAAPRTGDVRHSLADITRARQALGFEPRVSFEQGLAQTVDWYRKANSHATSLHAERA